MTLTTDQRILCTLTIVVILIWLAFVRPPFAYHATIVTIPEGATTREAGELLQKAGVVVSSRAFSLLTRLLGGAHYGAFSFAEPVTVIEAAWRVAHNDTQLPMIRVTVPEGASVREVGDILAGSLPGFDAAQFKALAAKDEGYLFPETYFFAAGASPREVRDAMRATFNTKIVELAPDIASSTRSLAEVVTMASLLEKEARTYETRQIIAGILWKRLDLGMPLQVDAVFGYILERDTFSPTFTQLATDSPYNTYTNKGLPPGPIGNPGLEALKAALHPVKTPYLYYLTGSDGVMHYATTFAEHVANRKYLK